MQWRIFATVQAFIHDCSDRRKWKKDYERSETRSYQAQPPLLPSRSAPMTAGPSETPPDVTGQSYRHATEGTIIKGIVIYSSNRGRYFFWFPSRHFESSMPILSTSPQSRRIDWLRRRYRACRALRARTSDQHFHSALTSVYLNYSLLTAIFMCSDTVRQNKILHCNCGDEIQLLNIRRTQ